MNQRADIELLVAVFEVEGELVVDVVTDQGRALRLAPETAQRLSVSLAQAVRAAVAGGHVLDPSKIRELGASAPAEEPPA